MTFVPCLSQDLLWTKNSRSRVENHQKQNLSRKALCSSPHLWPTAPTGANTQQTVIATRLLDSWKENWQCVYFYTAKKSNGAFSLGGVLWKLEKWSQPPQWFSPVPLEQRAASSLALFPGTWWLMRRSRLGERDTTNAVISISIRQINAANHPDDVDAQRRLSARVRVMSVLSLGSRPLARCLQAWGWIWFFSFS